MNNFWKWILGIVIVLVVLFGLGVGARLLLANTLPPPAGGFPGFPHPMMGGRGFDRAGGLLPFGGLLMFGMGTRWLLSLLLVGLLAYGAYRLGVHKSPASQETLPPPVPLRTCTGCGREVQSGWNHCAHCGKKIG